MAPERLLIQFTMTTTTYNNNTIMNIINIIVRESFLFALSILFAGVLVRLLIKSIETIVPHRSIHSFFVSSSRQSLSAYKEGSFVEVISFLTLLKVLFGYWFGVLCFLIRFWSAFNLVLFVVFFLFPVVTLVLVLQWLVRRGLLFFTVRGSRSSTKSEQLRQKMTHAPILPAIQEYESNLVVVLDLDECLIHSEFVTGPGAEYAHQVKRANGAALGESSVDTFNITLPDGELVCVHERPHLREFLARVSEKYETHVFTAGMDVYAQAVVKMLDPHGTIFTGIWSRESCTFDSSLGAYVKKLDFAWGGDKLKRTVLVDNNPLSFLANPENGILVSNFYNDPKDTTLPAVLDLLHELDDEHDVRPVLDARFGLRQALDELSSGRPFAAREQQLDEQQEKPITDPSESEQRQPEPEHNEPLDELNGEDSDLFFSDDSDAASPPDEQQEEPITAPSKSEPSESEQRQPEPEHNEPLDELNGEDSDLVFSDDSDAASPPAASRRTRLRRSAPLRRSARLACRGLGSIYLSGVRRSARLAIA